MIQWHLENKKISELKDHPRNPRSLSKEQEEHIKTSLEKFGLADKPIINTDGMIIGGHQRKRILKKLGYKTIDCWIPDRTLTDKEVDELNIRLNKNSGDFDYDILANEWNADELLSWGFTTQELLDIDVEDVSSDEEEIEKQCKLCPHCGKEID